MTRAPLHGTSDRLNIQWTGKWVCLPFELSQMPLVPMDTNPRGCMHAEVDRGSSQTSVCYAFSQPCVIQIPYPVPLMYRLYQYWMSPTLEWQLILQLDGRPCSLSDSLPEYPQSKTPSTRTTSLRLHSPPSHGRLIARAPSILTRAGPWLLGLDPVPHNRPAVTRHLTYWQETGI